MVVMKRALAFTTRAVFSGLLILVPLYLAILLLLKGMKSVAGLVRPFALLLPDWIPAETALSLVLVLVLCFIIGAAVLTRTGQAARNRIERTFFERIPGYALLRGLTQQMAGALKTVSRWGSGAKDLVAAMERAEGVRTLHSL